MHGLEHLVSDILSSYHQASLSSYGSHERFTVVIGNIFSAFFAGRPLEI